MLGKRTKGESWGDIGPIAQHGINNLVGGWGCRGLPNSQRLRRSAVTLLYCPDQRLNRYVGIGLGGYQNPILLHPNLRCKGLYP